MLFTDIEGSTRLLHELGPDGYAAALMEHRRIIRGACRAHGGVEVDTQGDAFFLAFGTPSGAIQAAREMTDDLADGPIHVRIGVHTGYPTLTDEGYVGEDVHLAARVGASAHGGQVVVTHACTRLAGDAGLRELGEHRLKDIADPSRCSSWAMRSSRPCAPCRTRTCPGRRARSSGAERTSRAFSGCSERGPGSSR